MCRQAVLSKEALRELGRENFIHFGRFLERSGGGAGNGAGFISARSGMARAFKGVEASWEDLWGWLDKTYDDILDNVIIHTRIPSVGRKSDALTHPFIENPNDAFPTVVEWDLDAYVNDSDYRGQVYRHIPTVLAFNGTWRDWKDYYPTLAMGGYDMPWFDTSDVSDALVMAKMIFAMGDKMAPAISSGAAIILHPGEVLLAVGSSRILKKAYYGGYPVISSAIPADLGFDNVDLWNVKRGQWYTQDLDLPESMLEEYTKYGRKTSYKTSNRHVFKSTECDGCGEKKHCRVMGDDTAWCYQCRQKDDWNEEDHEEGADVTAEEYDPKEEKEDKNKGKDEDHPIVVAGVKRKGSGSNGSSTRRTVSTSQPLQPGHIRPPSGNEENVQTPPFVARLTVNNSRQLIADGTLKQLDDRWPQLWYDQSKDRIMWMVNLRGGSEASTDFYVLGSSDEFFGGDILLSMQLGTGAIRTLYSKPEWGAVWADLDTGVFRLWDSKWLSAALQRKMHVTYIEGYSGDSTTALYNTVITDWEAVANPKNGTLLYQWGMVFDFKSLAEFLARSHHEGREVRLTYSYFGELLSNNSVREYVDDFDTGFVETDPTAITTDVVFCDNCESMPATHILKDLSALCQSCYTSIGGQVESEYEEGGLQHVV